MIVDCALDRQASYSVRGRKVLSCEIEVMRSLATRLAGKSFPRVAKYFALQNADCDDNATHTSSSARARHAAHLRFRDARSSAPESECCRREKPEGGRRPGRSPLHRCRAGPESSC